jgi:hypothetical protein
VEAALPGGWEREQGMTPAPGTAEPSLASAEPFDVTRSGDDEVGGTTVESEPGDSVPGEPVPDAAAEGATWVPVPVPPPVYTMKPAATRIESVRHSAVAAPESGESSPWEPRPGSDAPSFADELDLDAVLARRRAASG